MTRINPQISTRIKNKLAWRRTQPYAVVSPAVVGTVFGGASRGPRNAVLGGGVTHANFANGAFGGAPYGATNAVLRGAELRHGGLQWSSV
eukprot:6772994-Pyramimonas_sp.AAC.1